MKKLSILDCGNHIMSIWGSGILRFPPAEIAPLYSLWFPATNIAECLRVGLWWMKTHFPKNLAHYVRWNYTRQIRVSRCSDRGLGSIWFWTFSEVCMVSRISRRQYKFLRPQGSDSLSFIDFRPQKLTVTILGRFEIYWALPARVQISSLSFFSQ